MAAVALHAPHTASARSPFNVVTPVAGIVPAGSIPVRAKLRVKRSARVRVARFYVNGRRVTTDRRYPFQTKSGLRFDTTALPPTGGTLKLKLRYVRRSLGGRLVSKTLSRHVKLTLPSITPTGSGGCDRTQLVENFDAATLSDCHWNTQRSDFKSGGMGFYPFNWIEGAGYSNSAKNVSIADGKLNLTVSDDATGNATHNYSKSTGSVNTLGKFGFRYGYLETRAKVDKCTGCWPSIWMMPVAQHWPPEVDIFEYAGTLENPTPFSTPHWYSANNPNEPDVNWEPSAQTPAENQAFKNFYIADGADTTGAWHTYGMRWTPSSLEFFFDGKFGGGIYNSARIPQEPMYLVLMMAIADPARVAQRYPGVTVGWAPAGSKMQVDYVHISPQGP